ncbi:hypothetical protein D3C85_1440370 [compost metagenome]
MPGATGRVADLNVFGANDLEEVCFLSLGLDVVVHLPNQPRAGVVEHPQATQGVFHQVAHDIVRGEKLGGGRNILRGDFPFLL